nr:unnamed protein product [Callosobruchus analis]
MSRPENVLMSKQKQVISKPILPGNNNGLTPSARDQRTPSKPGLKKMSSRKRQSRLKTKKSNCMNVSNSAIEGPSFIENTNISLKNWPLSGIPEEHLAKKKMLVANIDKNIDCYSVQNKSSYKTFSNQISSVYSLTENDSVHSSTLTHFQSIGGSPATSEDSSHSETQSDSELFFFDITGDQSNTSQNKNLFSKTSDPSSSLLGSQCSSKDEDVITEFSNTTGSDYVENSISFNQFNFDDLRYSSESSEEEVILEQENKSGTDRPIADHYVEVCDDSGTFDDILHSEKEKFEEIHFAGENYERTDATKGNVSNNDTSNICNDTFILASAEDIPNGMKCNGQELPVEESSSELESDHGHRVTKASPNSSQTRNIYPQIINESFSSSNAEEYKTNEFSSKIEYETELPENRYDVEEKQDIENVSKIPETLLNIGSNNDSDKMLNGIHDRVIQNNKGVQEQIETIDLEPEKPDFWPKILSELKLEKKQREQNSTSPKKVKKMQVVHENHKIKNKIKAETKITKKKQFNNSSNIELLHEILRKRSINIHEESDKVYEANEHPKKVQDEINDVQTDGNIDFETKVSSAMKTKEKKLEKITTHSEMIQGVKSMQNKHADSEALDKSTTSSSKSKKNKHSKDTGNSVMPHGIGGIEYAEEYKDNIASRDENIELETKASKMKRMKLRESISNPEKSQCTKHMQTIYAESEILDTNGTSSSKSKKNKQLEDLEQHKKSGIEYTKLYEEDVGSQEGNIEFETKVSPAFKTKKKKLKKVLATLK